MLSITTIELSTSIPTPRASPINDIIFNVIPCIYKNAKATITDVGRATDTINVALIFLKNKKSTRAANTIPCKALLATLLIDWLISVESSWAIVNLISSDADFWISEITFLTSSTISIVFPSSDLVTAILTESFPLSLDFELISSLV